jgi:cytidyltransferase-like protein
LSVSERETNTRDGLSILRTRIITDYADLSKLVQGLKVTKQRIGATIGTFDFLHPGHARYLMIAKSHCDILFVGTDTDAVVKAYKKDDTRPIVPQDERLEMLLHTPYVDYASLIMDVDESGKWSYGFLDAIRPDIFITSIGSYTEEQLTNIRERSGEVLELERQAETSTSEKVRRMMISIRKPLSQKLRDLADTVEAGEEA